MPTLCRYPAWIHCSPACPPQHPTGHLGIDTGTVLAAIEVAVTADRPDAQADAARTKRTNYAPIMARDPSAASGNRTSHTHLTPPPRSIPDPSSRRQCCLHPSVVSLHILPARATCAWSRIPPHPRPILPPIIHIHPYRGHARDPGFLHAGGWLGSPARPRAPQSLDARRLAPGAVRVQPLQALLDMRQPRFCLPSPPKKRPPSAHSRLFVSGANSHVERLLRVLRVRWLGRLCTFELWL